MLVLTRRRNQRIIVDTPAGQLVVTLVEIRDNKARIGFEGDKRTFSIRREEVPAVQTIYGAMPLGE